jgi:hypothetical protein
LHRAALFGQLVTQRVAGHREAAVLLPVLRKAPANTVAGLRKAGLLLCVGRARRPPAALRAARPHRDDVRRTIASSARGRRRPPGGRVLPADDGERVSGLCPKGKGSFSLLDNDVLTSQDQGEIKSDPALVQSLDIPLIALPAPANRSMVDVADPAMAMAETAAFR